jgi:hypothetical protein
MKRYLFLMAVCAVLLVGVATPLHAGLIGVGQFVNTSYDQTSSSPPVTPFGYFYSNGGNFGTANEFDTFSLTYPAPGLPLTLSQTDPTDFSGQTGYYFSLAALQSDFPFGTYTDTVSGTSPTQFGMYQYSENAFTSDIPALDPGTYTGLQGMNPSLGMTLNFNSFTPPADSNAAFMFVNIYDGGNIIYAQGFLSPSTTSVFLPGFTLVGNHSYEYEVNFDNRLYGYDTADSVFTQQGFDVRTDGSFTTGPLVTPEPGTFALLALGLGGVALLKKKRSS